LAEKHLQPFDNDVAQYSVQALSAKNVGQLSVLRVSWVSKSYM